LKKAIYALLALFLVIPLRSSLAGQFKVTRVHDAETIRAEGHGIEIIVRLAGIDAPGISEEGGAPDQPFALEAKSHLAEIILNKDVEIEGHGVDENNRVLGVIYVKGLNVNLDMIKAGYAEIYRGNPPHPLYLLPYIKAEESARKARRGIWKLPRGIGGSAQSSARR
jgi:micrococcal nuclease